MIRVVLFLLIMTGCLFFSGCGNQPPPAIIQLDNYPVPNYKPSPVFVIYPADRTVKVGQSATFTVLAAGEGEIHYQWYLNGSPIQGAQTSNYTVPPATLENDGAIYTVVASNAYGSVQSLCKLHVQISLALLQINSVQITLPNGPGMLPGETLPLVIAVAQSDDQILLTEGRGGGKVSWDNFSIQSSIAIVDGSGNVSLPKDPRVSDGVVPKLLASVTGHPNLTAMLTIPVRYNGAFIGDFSGAPGTSGTSGIDGMSGFSGFSGSCDPDNLESGEDGTGGGAGGDGGDGGPGAHGPDIKTWGPPAFRSSTTS